MTLGGLLAGAHNIIYAIGGWRPFRRKLRATTFEQEHAECEFLFRRYFAEQPLGRLQIVMRLDTSAFERSVAPFVAPRRKVIPWAAWNIEAQEAAVRDLYEARL